MKRLFAMLLALCLLLSCFPVAASAAENKLDFADLNAKTVRFQKNKTLIREKDFTVTTKNIRAVAGGYLLLELEVRNTGKESFFSLSRDTMIGGYDIAAGMYKTVKPGAKVTEEIYIDVLPLAAVGLDVLNNLQIFFDVINAKTYKSMYEDCSITVPLGIPIEMDYDPYETCIYNKQGLKLTLLGSAQMERLSGPSWIFRLENKMGVPVVVENDSEFKVNGKKTSQFIYETVEADADYLFVLDCEGTGASKKSMVAEFPLIIRDRNYKDLGEMKIQLTMNQTGKIGKILCTGQGVTLGQDSTKPAEESGNMFLGTFDHYKVDSQYASILRKKYPEDTKLYSDDCFLPYVSELLNLYLDELDKAGYDFEVIERPDLCKELAYVVELTEKGKSVIQISFDQVEYDPKAAYIMTLGCSMDYNNLDKTNDYLAAMWMAYEMLNIDLTEYERSHVIDNSETMVDETYGVMMRGQFHGLGYVQATGDKETYLIISPDLTLPVFKGMK